MAVVQKPKLSSSEGKELQSFREKLRKEFGPDGIVEVKPLVTRCRPMVDEQNLTWHERHRPVATTVPIRIPDAGPPQNGLRSDKVIEMKIWPLPGRTDQFPEAKSYFRTPFALLEWLAKKENGLGRLYWLKAVPEEQIKIEKDAEMDPVSRKLWDKLSKSYQTNDEMIGVSRQTADAEGELSTGMAVDEESDVIAQEDPYTGEPMMVDEEVEA